jgi:hypothetical protein
MTTIRELRLEDAATCDDIVAGLPYFFGDAAGVEECSRDLRSQQGWVAQDGDQVTGFLTLVQPRERGDHLAGSARRLSARRAWTPADRGH